MDIGRAFTFITEEEDWWRKVLIGGLISLIPIVGQLYLTGYVTQVLKNTIEGRELPLPEVTEDFGDKLLKGLMVVIIAFILFLPVIIVGSISGVGSALLGGAFADSDAAEAAGAVMAFWGICFGCVTMVLGIAISLLLPFAWGKYAESGQFGDAFKFGELFGMLKANLGSTVIAILLSTAAGIVAGIAGSILCGIGFFFTGFYAQLVTAFLYGSVYREAKTKTL
jgi:hypothetical protein